MSIPGSPPQPPITHLDNFIKTINKLQQPGPHPRSIKSESRRQAAVEAPWVVPRFGQGEGRELP